MFNANHDPQASYPVSQKILFVQIKENSPTIPDISDVQKRIDKFVEQCSIDRDSVFTDTSVSSASKKESESVEVTFEEGILQIGSIHSTRIFREAVGPSHCELLSELLLLIWCTNSFSMTCTI